MSKMLIRTWNTMVVCKNDCVASYILLWKGPGGKVLQTDITLQEKVLLMASICQICK